eukprot:gene5005-8603_t
MHFKLYYSFLNEDTNRRVVLQNLISSQTFLIARCNTTIAGFAGNIKKYENILKSKFKIRDIDSTEWRYDTQIKNNEE